MVLYDASGLVPRALLCGATLTALRTAQASAIATDALARADSRVLAVLGTGEQAEAHIAALHGVRHFSADGSVFFDDDYVIKGVAGRILWLGHVPTTQLAALRGRALCQLVPSRAEGETSPSGRSRPRPRRLISGPITGGRA